MPRTPAGAGPQVTPHGLGGGRCVCECVHMCESVCNVYVACVCPTRVCMFACCVYRVLCVQVCMFVCQPGPMCVLCVCLCCCVLCVHACLYVCAVCTTVCLHCV